MTTKVEIEHKPAHGAGLPPWGTWGDTKIFEVTGVPLASSISAYQQLVHFEYKRPESCRFFFAARLLSSTTLPLPVSVTMEFQVTFGNGFTTFQSDFFQTLEFAVGFANPGDLRMCTQIEAFKANTAQTAPNIIEVLPASNFYVNARIVTLGSINAGTKLVMQATALVAPNVHVRPGWWLERFPGKEEA